LNARVKMVFSTGRANKAYNYTYIFIYLDDVAISKCHTWIKVTISILLNKVKLNDESKYV